MSTSKTEKATPKKRQDAARRGQMFKARDLVVACLSFSAGLYVIWGSSLVPLGVPLLDAMRHPGHLAPWPYTVALLHAACIVLLPVMLVAIIATTLCSLLQSGFRLATEAIRFDADAVNPVRGFKRIFSMRTIKDAGKAVIYLACFSAALLAVAWQALPAVLSQVHAGVPALIAVWRRLASELLLTALACIVIVLVLDVLAEWFLYLKELRMDKREVRQERKDMEGDPMIKGERRQMHIELLSAQDRHDIENSRVIIANPTHIAIGIYFKPDISPIPMISVRASNQRALAVRQHARRMGVPVIVDVALARRIYRSHRCYEPVSLEEIYAVVHLLLWLQEVEEAGACQLPREEPPKEAG